MDDNCAEKVLSSIVWGILRIYGYFYFQTVGCTLTFKILGCVSVLLRRALEWHSRGQRFDPAYLHHQWRKPMKAPDILSGAFLFVRHCFFHETWGSSAFLLYKSIANIRNVPFPRPCEQPEMMCKNFMD